MFMMPSVPVKRSPKFSPTLPAAKFTFNERVKLG